VTARLAVSVASAWLLVPALAGAVEQAPPPNLAGALVGVESTPVLGAYYERTGPGLLEPGAETGLGFVGAVLTGFSGGRLRAERDEVLLASHAWALRGVAGTGFTFANDAGGAYRAWTGVLGVRGTRELGPWVLGVRIAYLPVLFSHVRLSDALRDTWSGRYPDAREERGPASAELWLAGQRLEGLLTADARLGAWVVEMAGGVLLAPGAGREMASVESGQLPVVLRVATGRRF
jgi:hypothetical protein